MHTREIIQLKVFKEMLGVPYCSTITHMPKEVAQLDKTLRLKAL